MMEANIRMNGIAESMTFLANCSSVALLLITGMAMNPRINNITAAIGRPLGTPERVSSEFSIESSSVG
jgi:hypothetical protein